METIIYILVAYYFIQLEKASRNYFIVLFNRLKAANKRRKNRNRSPEQIQAEVLNVRLK